METDTSRTGKNGGHSGRGSAPVDSAANEDERIQELTVALGETTRLLDAQTARHADSMRTMKESLDRAENRAEESKARATLMVAGAATLGTCNAALAGWAKAESEVRLMRAKAETECMSVLVKALAEKAEPEVLLKALQTTGARDVTYKTINVE